MQDKNVFKHSFLPTDDGHHFFSSKNTAEDGWELTAPVDEYVLFLPLLSIAVTANFEIK